MIKYNAMWSEDDIRFMREALSLARSAEGRTTPDPMVGAVLVKEGRIISIGYHGEVTTPHAEAWAIQKAGAEARGATLYINLEPCCFFKAKNNPPCTDTIIKAGVKEVIAAMRDPNPRVKGRGFSRLKKHGVKVRVGLLGEEAQQLNEVFEKFITTGLPFVVMKTAMTIDGKIATRTGASRWVASKESLRYAHHLRNIYDAILVGVNNVLIDNPQLNVRRVKKVKDPVRIVLDAYGRTPPGAKVIRSSGGKTILVVGPEAPPEKLLSLEKAGAEVLRLPAPKGLIDIRMLLKKLGERKITSLLIEGGGEVNASFISARAVDKAYFFIAPKIFGGRDAKTPVEGEGIRLPLQARWLKDVRFEKSGADFLIVGHF
jgi:diaminohydroxyphosphoribosylaminopyrimidine deaminase/5-amino-6-(5-phosphoribosylamino)uracil reductase